MPNPLLDKEFLLKLDKQRNRKTYAKITSLDLNELPLEQIEGRVTGGSLNLDGTSAIRRTCSLTIIGQDLLITEPYWALKCKFKLEIGLENVIDSRYPNIIWFKQGTYGITSFSISENTNSFTISISGKDKMAYLNGDLGGNIFAQHDFGSYDEILSNGDIETKKIKIFDIIRQAVHEYGQEPFQNIVINDLDNCGYELWDYRGNDTTPMFYVYDTNYQLRNMLLNGDQLVYKNNETETTPIKLKDIQQSDLLWRNNLINQESIPTYTLNQSSNRIYYISRIDYGDTAGYHGTDLIYPGDLILNAGETITALLDKIKSILGEFEYFYDIDGRFIFQKKRTYVQGLFSPIIENVMNPTMTVSPYSYKFEDSELVTTYSNAPAIGNVKNDFAVWGTKKSASGADIPIHARYAIVHKPQKYNSLGYYQQILEEDYDNETKLYWYNSSKQQYEPIDENDDPKELNEIIYKYIEPTEFSIADYDWRELIYQMAIDFYAHNSEPDFINRLQQNNDWIKNGKTGYEPFYADMQAFWRQIYDPEGLEENDFIIDGIYKYWNKAAIYYPENLIFWIDFLDTYGELNNYSIETIGHRPKVENANGVTAITHKDTPEVEFKIIGIDNNLNKTGELSALTLFQIPEEARDLFNISSQGQSTMNKIDELIYQYVCMSESITINTIPIYYLEPNTRIYAHSELSKIDGDYIISRLSIPLTYNGTMSITATKVINQLK